MKKKTRKKYIDWQDIVIFLLALGFLLVIFGAVLAVAFPATARQVINSVRAKVTNVADAGPDGFQTAIQKRAESGYETRVKPIFDFLAKGFQSSQEETKKPSFKAGACMECHNDIFDKTTFGMIKVDHRLHDAQGLDCNSCHADTEHDPKPKRVSEASCTKCHKRQGGPVRETKDCPACHPPGTIFATASTKNVAEFMSGNQDSGVSLVPEGFGHPVGDKAKACAKCHSIEGFCTACHGMSRDKQLRSPHEAKWRNVHGTRVMMSQGTIQGCGNCHTQLIFCAGACHPNVDRQRNSPNWTVPRRTLSGT